MENCPVCGKNLHGKRLIRLQKNSKELPRTLDIYENGFTVYRRLDGALIEECQMRDNSNAIEFFKARGYHEIGNHEQSLKGDA